VLVEAFGAPAVREVLPSSDQAQKRLVELIRQQLDDGFVPVHGPDADEPDEAGQVLHRQAAFEARIEARPDALEGYQVYADWLLEQGDPWGELIALQVAKETTAADRLLERQTQQLFGPLTFAVRFRDLTVTWRDGFIRSAQVLERPDSNEPAAGVVSELLRSRLSRFLRELRLGNGATQGCLSAVASSPRW
jgi:uncharacterized protein (TIGR02996 family)